MNGYSSLSQFTFINYHAIGDRDPIQTYRRQNDRHDAIEEVRIFRRRAHRSFMEFCAQRLDEVGQERLSPSIRVNEQHVAYPPRFLEPEEGWLHSA